MPAEAAVAAGGGSSGGAAAVAPAPSSSTPPASVSLSEGEGAPEHFESERGDINKSDYTVKQAAKAPVVAAPAKGAPPAAPAKGQTGSINADMISRAEEYGISAEEAGTLGEERLQRTLDLMDRRFAKGDAVKPPAGKPTTGQSANAQAQAEGTPEAADVWGKLDAFVKRTNDEGGEIAPEIIEALTYSKGLEGKLKEMGEKMDRVYGSYETQRVTQMRNDIDSSISELGEEWVSIFGKDTHEKLDFNSEQGKNRDRLTQEMDILAAGYQAADQRVPPTKELLKRAARSAFHEHTDKIASQKIVAKIRRGEGTIMSEPSNRTANDGMTPDKRAAREIDAKLKALGAHESQDD